MRAMREWALVEAAKSIRAFRTSGFEMETGFDERDQEDASRELGRVIYDLLKLAGVRACKTCGCSEEDACEEGCSWVGPNLCSAYERGELTQKEYMREMAELRRSVQAEARERAQEAYDREMDKW